MYVKKLCAHKMMTIFSFQGMIATKKVDSVDQMIIEPHHAPSYYERSAGLSKSIPGRYVSGPEQPRAA